jgi:hypothetical protein
MLHGPIELNHVVIGEWTATRKNTPKQEFNIYACTLWYRGTDGYIYEAEWEIWGVHGGNGAISLAARVLLEGNMKAKRRPVRD